MPVDHIALVREQLAEGYDVLWPVAAGELIEPGEVVAIIFEVGRDSLRQASQQFADVGDLIARNPKSAGS